MLNIRLANDNEYESVRRFYHSLIFLMKSSNAKYMPGWEIDIYPDPDYLKNSICKKELYIGEDNWQIVSCMIVNHDSNEGYQRFAWSTVAKPNEITVIHALGVHPDFVGNGYAGEMVRKAISLAKDSNQKAIRLDVLKGNLPAEKLYEKHGFSKCGTIQMFYEDTGWTDYELYELVL